MAASSPTMGVKLTLVPSVPGQFSLIVAHQRVIGIRQSAADAAGPLDAAALLAALDDSEVELYYWSNCWLSDGTSAEPRRVPAMVAVILFVGLWVTRPSLPLPQDVKESVRALTTEHENVFDGSRASRDGFCA